MARALQYAERDGPLPRRLEVLHLVKLFGAHSIYGRPIGYHEVRDMLMQADVVSAFQEREKENNWAAWAVNNPYKSKLLEGALSARLLIDGEKQ